MPVTVLLFGATADIVGTRELTMDAAGRSAAHLLDEIVSNHPKLASHKLLLSVNQEYISDSRRLADGDEVAIFTAVSGG